MERVESMHQWEYGMRQYCLFRFSLLFRRCFESSCIHTTSHYIAILWHSFLIKSYHGTILPPCLVTESPMEKEARPSRWEHLPEWSRRGWCKPKSQTPRLERRSKGLECIHLRNNGRLDASDLSEQKWFDSKPTGSNRTFLRIQLLLRTLHWISKVYNYPTTISTIFPIL